MEKNDFFSEILRKKSEKKNLYIYGVGLYGQNIYKILRKEKIKIDGFIVSSSADNAVAYDSVPIIEVSKCAIEEAVIIVGVNRHNAVEIERKLSALRIDDRYIIKGYYFIDRDGIRGGYDEIPTIEITTNIGCKISCRFCPQKLLLSRYFDNDRQRINILSREDFEYFLGKLPDECTVLFSGMAEPFLNPHCIDMIETACNKGYKVDLYTTMVGLDEKQLDRLLGLPIDFVGLHVADKYGYAKIPVSNQYYKKLERILESKKSDGSPFVNVCNAQSDPDEVVSQICGDRYDVLTTMLDRAGNLDEDSLFRKTCEKGKLSCSLCGDKLNHNVLLPDGTVLLCCMDYAMKHILGNLNIDTYDSLFLSEEYELLQRGIQGDDTIDILCRKCSCANSAL